MSPRTKGSVIKNIFSIFIGQFLNLFMSFWGITIAARYLSLEAFGEFNYLVALIMIISKAIDLGLGPIAFKEISLTFPDFNAIDTALSVRTALVACIILPLGILLFLTGHTQTQIMLALLLLFNNIISAKFQNIRELLDIPFKVSHKMHLSSIGMFVDNFLFLILVYMMPLLHAGFTYFMIIYVFANVPGFVFVVAVLKKKYSYAFHFTLKNAKPLIKRSAPMFGYVLAITLYQQVDLLLLKSFRNAEAVGIYAAAVRIVQPLLIIPSALVATFFPVIVSEANKQSEKTNVLIIVLFKILFAIAVILFFVVGFRARDFVTILFGAKFLLATVGVFLLLAANIFMFINFLVVDLLTAYDKQKYAFYYVIVLTFVNVVLSIILIPSFSYNGVAVTKVVATLIGFLFLAFMKKYHHINLLFFDVSSLRWFVGLAAFHLLLFYYGLPLLVYGIASLLLITFSLRIFKYFTASEREFILQYFPFLKKLSILF